MPSPIPSGANAQYYANGRGLARYQGQKPLAVDPAAGTPIWWSNEGVKDVWAGVPSRTGTETIWRDNGGALRPVIGGPDAVSNPGTNPPQGGAGPAPAYAPRKAPMYQPRAGQTGPSYYIPPPPVPVSSGGVAMTYEVYGRMNGRQIPLWKELSFDGVAFHIKQGGRILISHSPAEGYGFGGTPGAGRSFMEVALRRIGGLIQIRAWWRLMGHVRMQCPRRSWSRSSGRVGGRLCMRRASKGPLCRHEGADDR